MRKLVLTVVVLALAGCAAAAPGFSPTAETKLPPQLKPFNGGAVDKSGSYVVTPAERALGCPKLTGSMHVMIARIKDSSSRPRASTATTAMQTAAKPFVGAGANLDVDEEIRQVRARLTAYNALLAEKKCKTLDIAGI